MKKTLVLLLVFAATSQAVSAQREREEAEPQKKGFDKSKLFYGGNFGASFGDYTLANVSPQIGYRFNDHFAAGAGVNFIYSSVKYRDFNGNSLYRASYGVTGLNVFGRVYPIKYLLLQAQPEMNYTWGKYKYYDGVTPTEKVPGKLVPSLLLGGGVVIPEGRGALVIMVQYDVLNNVRSPYGTRPIYNFGYNIGF